ncbi:MAG: hypothetical protein KDA75_08630 [Planctomycetaceae bacterium]|nr:hypothetical protein [Planctomycetaceae bacterium]
MKKVIFPIAMTASLALTAPNASAGILYNLFHPRTWGGGCNSCEPCHRAPVYPTCAAGGCQVAPLPYQYGQPAYPIGNPYPNPGYMNYPPVGGCGPYGPCGQVSPVGHW